MTVPRDRQEADDDYEEEEYEEEDAPDPSDGFTLVEVRYEYTMWGDDRWLIAGFERANGDFGIYDFMLQEWLDVVPAQQSGRACRRVVDDWLDNNFRGASIPTSLALDGLSRPDVRHLLTHRVAFEEAQIDGAIEAAPSANPYQESDIVAEWERTVTLDPASTDSPLSADLVTQFFADVEDPTAGTPFETWLDGAILRWRDSGGVLEREEAHGLLRLCRYIAACCR